MAFQSPLVSIPKKTTTDVDWTGPIRTIIAQSYGEDPRQYVEECAVLQRCRQDAVRGAGSDNTARDLIYKYFGQLELLELRFAEIKVTFPWNDAFTEKLTTQTSLAFEKASIIHLLSSVLSALASSSSRADPEGLKRAYFNSRAAAGMLTYINENFLHAPSTDLSREVVHFCGGLMSAQATEIFTEKLVEEKKAPGLVARSANQTAGMYAGLVEEMKDFQGKGIFDRNWLFIVTIKSKLFASLAQYYRSTADAAAGKHGAALVRMRLADTLAQEAARQANGFTFSFVSASTPTLPSDAATSLVEITKAQAATCKEAKEQATRDNDLIYHDILPSEASLPAVDKLPPAAPITIQEIYANPDVSKLIGSDIFGRLIPLAVHESASIYSEEKAKLVRSEVERVDMSEGEIRAGLEHLGLPGLVHQWRRVVDSDEVEGDEVEISSSIRRLAEDVQRGGAIEPMLRQLESEREKAERELRELTAMLDNESRDCERLRAKFNPQFTQSPSGPHTAHFRSNISSNLGSLQAAASSDSNVQSLWREIKDQVGALSAGPSGLSRVAKEIAAGKQTKPEDRGQSLLDLQEDMSATTSGMDPIEKEQLTQAINDASERLERLGKIRKERDDVLKDLKGKLQNDDVSNLLLLNRRAQSGDNQLFATELEKFRPYQSRISAAVSACQSVVQELEALVHQVEKGKGMKERSRSTRDRTRRLRDWEKNLESVGEQYSEVRGGLGKGLGFYESLSVVIDELKREVRGYVSTREGERNRMVGEIEMRQRISGGGSAPPPPTNPSSRGIESQLSSMSLGGGYSSSSSAYPSSPSGPYVPPPPKPVSAYSSMNPNLPPPPSPAGTSRYTSPPPSNPYDFGGSSGLPSAFQTSTSPPPIQARQPSYPSYTPPPASSSPYPAPPSRPSQQSQSYVPPPQQSYGYQPPPPTQPSYPSYNPSSAYPAPPPQTQRQTSSHYPTPPPQQQSYAPPPQQQHGYPSHLPSGQSAYPPPNQHQHGYGSQTPAPTYGGYQQPPPQGGYGYR